MLRLSNIRIPVRIALACLLPLLAFIGFAGKELLQKRADYSSAAEIAAASAADWFCRWTANHNPTSMPIPANPIRTGRRMPTATATAPRRSRENRAQIGGTEIAASLTLTSRDPNQLASGSGASDYCLLEKINHAQYQGRPDHDHHRG